MSDAAAEPHPGPLRRTLRARLGALGAPLQILAEGLLGEGDSRIDWIAVEPAGRLWVILVDEDGKDDHLLVRGLAQRAWVRARLPDWQQLARDLPARSEPQPLLALVAPAFSRLVRAAAHEADPAGGIRLGHFRWQPGPHGNAELLLEPVPPLEATARRDAPPPESAPSGTGHVLASSFKSGLTDRDFESPNGRQDGRLEGGDNSRPADDNF